MALGPWYVGDRPTAALVVSVTRNGAPLPLDGYSSADVLLYAPSGSTVAWGATPTIDTAADTVTIPAPPSSPFATRGIYLLYLRLTTGAGATETVRVAELEVLVPGPVEWPPSLADLKHEMQIDPDDTTSDTELADALAASVTFVERVRSDVVYTGGAGGPTADLRLGTLRLAARWHTRRRSPDALIQMAEMGAARVPAFDPDIDRLLRIGKYRGAVFA